MEKLAKISRERKDSTSFFFERREYAITFGIPCTSLFMSPDIAGPYVMCKRQKEERERERQARFLTRAALSRDDDDDVAALLHLRTGRGSPISEPRIYRHMATKAEIRNFNSRGHARDLAILA